MPGVRPYSVADFDAVICFDHGLRYHLCGLVQVGQSLFLLDFRDQCADSEVVLQDVALAGLLQFNESIKCFHGLSPSS